METHACMFFVVVVVVLLSAQKRYMSFLFKFHWSKPVSWL